MFKDNLKELRLRNGWSQEELGSKIISKGKPVSGKTVWSWESGRTEPNMGVVQQLADLFHVSADQLVDREKQQLFSSAQEAIKYILGVPLVADFGGYDLSSMTDEEIIAFATEVAEMIKVLSKRYQKGEKI